MKTVGNNKLQLDNKESQKTQKPTELTKTIAADDNTAKETRQCVNGVCTTSWKPTITQAA